MSYYQPDGGTARPDGESWAAWFLAVHDAAVKRQDDGAPAPAEGPAP